MSASGLAPARVSPVDAAQQAVEHTRLHLFPFRFERWLVLGFLAFLDQCGRGGGGSFHIPAPGGGPMEGGSGEAQASHFVEWMGAHALVAASVAAVAIALVVAVTALVLWVGSRGIFVYMDDVATGRADVVRPWREHAERADSLFAWRFVVALVTLVGTLGILALAALLAFAAWRDRIPTGAAVAAGLVVLLPAFLALAVAYALVSVALRDFVAPLQWLHGLSCGSALRAFGALLRARPGTFALYVLLKAAFSFVLGIVALAAGCLTCCCAFLPVVSQTALQPLYYFERAWSLCLMRQLGHDVLRPAMTQVSDTLE